MSRKLLQGIIAARRDLCKAICSSLLCRGVVPVSPVLFFFCWKCSGNQHEAYTCHELMCSSCQGLHLGSINRVEETFQGSVFMFNPLPTTSLSLPEKPAICQTTARPFGILLLLFDIFWFGRQTGERKVNSSGPSSARSVGLFKKPRKNEAKPWPGESVHWQK